MDTKVGKVVKFKNDYFLTDSNNIYLLRRKDGDEYSDTVWESINGRKIKATGSIEPKDWGIETFFVEVWEFTD